MRRQATNRLRERVFRELEALVHSADDTMLHGLFSSLHHQADEEGRSQAERLFRVLFGVLAPDERDSVLRSLLRILFGDEGKSAPPPLAEKDRGSLSPAAKPRLRVVGGMALADDRPCPA